MLGAERLSGLSRCSRPCSASADRASLEGRSPPGCTRTWGTGSRRAQTAGSTTTFAFVEPWGFEVGDISTPVLLLHGEDDRFVPVSHGHWLAARIPGVEARIDPADGHLTLFERRMREVNAWLLSHS